MASILVQKKKKFTPLANKVRVMAKANVKATVDIVLVEEKELVLLQ